MLVPQLGDHVIHDAWLPVDSFHYIMFESRRFREYQPRFIRRPQQPVRKRDACSRQRCRSKKFSAARKLGHGTLLVMSFRMFTTRKTCKHSVLGPSQLFHSHFRRVIRSADPAFQVFKVIVEADTIFTGICARWIVSSRST